MPRAAHLLACPLPHCSLKVLSPTAPAEVVSTGHLHLLLLINFLIAYATLEVPGSESRLGGEGEWLYLYDAGSQGLLLFQFGYSTVNYTVSVS